MTQEHDHFWDIIADMPACMLVMIDLAVLRASPLAPFIDKSSHTIRKDEVIDDQWDHTGKVVGYLKRHLSQSGPDEEKETSCWRYSLMNWGHDPLH